MKKVALIVEGKGDVKALPSLIAKSAADFDIQMVACDPPIRAGEAKKLMRTGELERYLKLASTREDAEEVILILDLDDGCVKDFFENFDGRARSISDQCGKPIHICFCVREYESWLLSSIKSIGKSLPEYGIPADAKINNPEQIRGAKETLRSLCKTKGYKQTRDQLLFTQKIDIKHLGANSRSFRKLLKAITSKTYSELTYHCAQ